MNARTAIAPEGLSVGINHLAFRNLRQHLQARIIGQEHLVESLLVALLADGHLLVEGAPGLAKTTAIKELAAALQGDFRRLQFTPDLLPGDLTGTDVYRPETGDFHFQPGPSVSQSDPCRRDQPRARQGAIRLAGSEWANTRSRWDATRIHCRGRSWSWRLKILSSMKALIRCPRRSSTAFCSMFASAIRTRKRNTRF